VSGSGVPGGAGVGATSARPPVVLLLYTLEGYVPTGPHYIIPSVFHPDVTPAVAAAVRDAAGGRPSAS